MISISALTDLLLQLAIGSTLILAAGALAMRLSRKVIARRRLGATTIMVLLAWIGLSFIPMQRPLSRETLRHHTDSEFAPAPRAAGWRPDSGPAPLAALGIVSPAVTDSSADTGAASEAELAFTQRKRSGRSPTGSEWLAIVFLAGSLLSAGYVALAWIVLRYRMRRAAPAPREIQQLADRLASGSGPVRVFIVSESERPFCFGLLRPSVVLPEGLCRPGQEQGLRAVLLHEIGHIRGRDLRDQALLAIALPFVYWHPLFWGVRRDLRLAAELLADDHASRGVERTAYVRELIHLVERTAGRPLAPALSIGGQASDFYRRMTMLLERAESLETRCSSRHDFFRTSGALALLAVVTLGFGANRAQAQERPKPTPESARTVAAKKVRETAPRFSIEATYTASRQLEDFVMAVAASGGSVRDLQVQKRVGRTKSKAFQATVHLPRESDGRPIDTLQSLTGPSGIKLMKVLHRNPRQATSQKRRAPAKTPSEPKISVSFNQTPIQKIVDSIAQMANANIVLAPEVQGTLTLRLKDVPWRSALEAATLSLGFVLVDLSDDIIMITTRQAAEVVQKENVKRK